MSNLRHHQPFFVLLIEQEFDEIVDFVENHYKHFGAYPIEVQTRYAVYTFDEYWSILDAGGYEDDKDA
jgi:hypothetical protein